MMGDRYILQLWDSLDMHEPIMCDSDEEFEKHSELFKNAHGNVLLIGLGIGFANRFLRKNGRVTSITVVEKEKEIIDKVKLPDVEVVIHDDGLTFIPYANYDTIWWDTWGVPTLEITKQLLRYSNYLNPGGWIGSFPI